MSVQAGVGPAFFAARVLLGGKHALLQGEGIKQLVRGRADV